MDKNNNLKTVLAFLSESPPLEHLPQSDAIFIFGHFDPRLPEHAAKLFNLEKAGRIIISGKGKKEIPGFKNEAQFYASILEELGISKDKLILEEQAMNCLENVKFGIEAAKKSGLNPKSLILVALPPLFRRAIATFRKQFPKIKTYASAFEFPVEEYQNKVKRLLGEFDRFDLYYKQGDMEKIEVPDKVRDAVEALKHVNKF
ncbi:MAG: YdcF family protein [Acidobacteriaceae bacterium]